MPTKKDDAKKDPVASLAELEKSVRAEKTARPRKARTAEPAAASPVAAARPAASPAPRPKTAGGAVRVRLVRSGICAPKDQKATLIGLGLRRIRQEVVRSDTPALRGMLLKVRHLVEVEER